MVSPEIEDYCCFHFSISPVGLALVTFVLLETRKAFSADQKFRNIVLRGYPHFKKARPSLHVKTSLQLGCSILNPSVGYQNHL
jgi:hypothetical protein